MTRGKGPVSDETKIFTKNDKNGDKCASGGQESGLKLIFERGVAILVRPWRFPGQPKKFVFFSIKVGTINSGTSLDSREQFKKTGKLEILYLWVYYAFSEFPVLCLHKFLFRTYYYSQANFVKNSLQVTIPTSDDQVGLVSITYL